VLNSYMQQTAEALAGFPPWSAEIRCLDLMEEAGELARALLLQQGHKTSDQGSEEVGIALCGVLADLFALAHHFSIDLDARYPHCLEQLVQSANQRRTARGPVGL
jgi:NTP pyrophosphatase (non-canonical NTP hydrolase)